MNEPRDRLKALMIAAGCKTAPEVARKFRGINQNTLTSNLNGHRAISRYAAAKYAKAFNSSAGWILYGEEEAGLNSAPAEIRFGGIIGAGQQVFPDADYGHPVPFRAEAVECFEVRGDSMFPVAREGDMLYFGPARPPRDLIGYEAIVELDDGSRYFKILKYGSSEGLFTLDSYNAPSMFDRPVLRAGRLLAISIKETLGR